MNAKKFVGGLMVLIMVLTIGYGGFGAVAYAADSQDPAAEELVQQITDLQVRIETLIQDQKTTRAQVQKLIDVHNDLNDVMSQNSDTLQDGKNQAFLDMFYEQGATLVSLYNSFNYIHFIVGFDKSAGKVYLWNSKDNKITEETNLYLNNGAEYYFNVSKLLPRFKLGTVAVKAVGKESEVSIDTDVMCQFNNGSVGKDSYVLYTGGDSVDMRGAWSLGIGGGKERFIKIKDNNAYVKLPVFNNLISTNVINLNGSKIDRKKIMEAAADLWKYDNYALNASGKNAEKSIGDLEQDFKTDYVNADNAVSFIAGAKIFGYTYVIFGGPVINSNGINQYAVEKIADKSFLLVNPDIKSRVYADYNKKMYEAKTEAEKKALVAPVYLKKAYELIPELSKISGGVADSFISAVCDYLKAKDTVSAGKVVAFGKEIVKYVTINKPNTTYWEDMGKESIILAGKTGAKTLSDITQKVLPAIKDIKDADLKLKIGRALFNAEIANSGDMLKIFNIIDKIKTFQGKQIDIQYLNNVCEDWTEVLSLEDFLYDTDKLGYVLEFSKWVEDFHPSINDDMIGRFFDSNKADEFLKDFKDEKEFKSFIRSVLGRNLDRSAVAVYKDNGKMRLCIVIGNRIGLVVDKESGELNDIKIFENRPGDWIRKQTDALYVILPVWSPADVPVQ